MSELSIVRQHPAHERLKYIFRRTVQLVAQGGKCSEVSLPCSKRSGPGQSDAGYSASWPTRHLVTVSPRR
jgi:hypothetical protein